MGILFSAFTVCMFADPCPLEYLKFFCPLVLINSIFLSEVIRARRDTLTQRSNYNSSSAVGSHRGCSGMLKISSLGVFPKLITNPFYFDH